jgi:hypothetical protein
MGSVSNSWKGLNEDSACSGSAVRDARRDSTLATGSSTRTSSFASPLPLRTSPLKAVGAVSSLSSVYSVTCFSNLLSIHVSRIILLRQ